MPRLILLWLAIQLVVTLVVTPSAFADCIPLGPPPLDCGTQAAAPSSGGQQQSGSNCDSISNLDVEAKIRCILRDSIQGVVRDLLGDTIVDGFKAVSMGPDELYNLFVNSPLNFVTQTPLDLTVTNSRVMGVFNQLKNPIKEILILAMMLSGVLTILLPFMGNMKEGTRDSLSRAFVAVIATLGILPLIKEVIIFNNAFCALIFKVALAGVFLKLPGFDAGMGMGILSFIYAVVALGFIGYMLYRLIRIDILILLAPFAMICYVSQRTESKTIGWIQEFGSRVLSQTIIAIVLLMGTFISDIFQIFGPLAPAVTLFAGICIFITAITSRGTLMALAAGVAPPIIRVPMAAFGALAGRGSRSRMAVA